MSKLIKKAAILSLVLVLLLAASATAFAVTSWSHIWTASDEVTQVEYDCNIRRTTTDGAIYSESNQGEVSMELDYWYIDHDNEPQRVHRYDNGIYYAGISESCAGNGVMERATYYFYAYVDTTGEEFDSGTITLIYP